MLHSTESDVLTSSISIIIVVNAAGQAGAGCRLNSSDDRAHLASKLLTDEGVGEAGKI